MEPFLQNMWNILAAAAAVATAALGASIAWVRKADAVTRRSKSNFDMINSLTERVSTLETRTVSVEAGQANLQTQLNYMKDSLSRVEDKVNGMDGKLSDLAQNVQYLVGAMRANAGFDKDNG